MTDGGETRDRDITGLWARWQPTEARLREVFRQTVRELATPEEFPDWLIEQHVSRAWFEVPMLESAVVWWETHGDRHTREVAAGLVEAWRAAQRR